MAKAVLISIRPEWVEKILAGEKTLEVRKTRPNMETPFKVYIYCTAGNLSYKVNGGMLCNVSGGKIVVGEFTCGNIATYNYDYCPHPEIGMDYNCGDSWWEIDDEDLKSACLEGGNVRLAYLRPENIRSAETAERIQGAAENEIWICAC